VTGEASNFKPEITPVGIDRSVSHVFCIRKIIAVALNGDGYHGVI